MVSLHKLNKMFQYFNKYSNSYYTYSLISIAPVLNYGDIMLFVHGMKIIFQYLYRTIVIYITSV